MLQLHDIRESRVYQEGREEALREVVVKMASHNMSAAEIVRILKLDLAVVERALAENVDPPVVIRVSSRL
ncbi:MAG: hypothetical protein U0793_06685 [Gemmataceae bacterium]